MSFWPDMKVVRKKLMQLQFLSLKFTQKKHKLLDFITLFLDQSTQQIGKVCSKCLKYELFSKTNAWPNSVTSEEYNWI